MRDITETIPTDPLQTEKSVRRATKRVLTSSHAAKIVPVVLEPVLREDRLASGRIRIAVDMAETGETLNNAIHVKAMAHFVPFLAFDRFRGMDDLNRSYQGIAEPNAQPAIPFFETIVFDRNADFWKTAGIHAKAGASVNTAYLEAYNEVVNFMSRARSEKLPLRTKNDTTLAPAFWVHSSLGNIVPDFDQAMIDGEVSLQFAATGLPLSAASAPVVRTGTNASLLRVASTGALPGGQTVSLNAASAFTGSTNTNAMQLDPNGALQATLTGITAQLSAQGVKLSLSNFEMAKRTAAFAQFREQRAGLGDDHLIDLLMEGIRIPDEAMRQPILLDSKTTLMGYNRRWATDAANLDESVTTGETFVDLNMRMPPMNTGGIIVVTVQVVPEQLWERRKDQFLHTTNPANLPNFLRDYLDPEKVAIVPNDFVDVDHATPTATFGYAPLNHEWQRDLVNIGGKYYRPTSDATFVEDRQRIWTVEQANPTLNADFYLARNIHQKVFADQVAHAFEYSARGEFEFVGNTVFGKGLVEKANNDYAEILAQTDQTRIVQA